MFAARNIIGGLCGLTQKDTDMNQSTGASPCSKTVEGLERFRLDEFKSFVVFKISRMSVKFLSKMFQKQNHIKWQAFCIACEH